MATPEKLEPVYYCTHCGWETKFQHFRIRERIQRDHTDPFECIRHLRNRLSEVSELLPPQWDEY